jgi:hypothetical protein
VENCKATALQSSCPNNSYVRGSYKFGDFSKAVGNAVTSAVEQTVVIKAVEKQRSLGKLERLGVKIERARGWYADAGGEEGLKSLLYKSLLKVSVGWGLLTFLCVLAIGARLHGLSGRILSTALCQGATGSMTLFVVAGLAAALVSGVASRAVAKSEVWSTFAKEVFKIDFEEINLDIVATGVVVGNVADYVLFTAGCGYVAGLAVWAQGIR